MISRHYVVEVVIYYACDRPQPHEQNNHFQKNGAGCEFENEILFSYYEVIKAWTVHVHGMYAVDCNSIRPKCMQQTKGNTTFFVESSVHLSSYFVLWHIAHSEPALYAVS